MKEDKNINLYEQAGLNVGYLSYNVEKKPLDNLKVRQALTTAVNKKRSSMRFIRARASLLKT